MADDKTKTLARAPRRRKPVVVSTADFARRTTHALSLHKRFLENLKKRCPELVEDFYELSRAQGAVIAGVIEVPTD